MKKLELYTTLACPHCKTMKRTIGEVMPDFNNQYIFTEISASSPLGYLKSLKNNIHSAPTLLVDGRVVARTSISKTELIHILKSEL
jgi:glutaredoxin